MLNRVKSWAAVLTLLAMVGWFIPAHATVTPAPAQLCDCAKKEGECPHAKGACKCGKDKANCKCDEKAQGECPHNKKTK